MKLSKVSARLTLRSAIAAIVMFMALLWILFLFGSRLDLGDFVVEYAMIGYGLFFVLLILLICCLLFFVRDIYIQSVTNKHPRATVAARVLGALGASVALIAFLVYPITPVGLFMSLMAIRGLKVALARPNVAGVLMLLAGVMPLIVVSVSWVFGELILYDLHPEDPLFAVIMLAWASYIALPASLLLIPGGVLALLAARRKRHQERLGSMSKS